MLVLHNRKKKMYCQQKKNVLSACVMCLCIQYVITQAHLSLSVITVTHAIKLILYDIMQVGTGNTHENNDRSLFATVETVSTLSAIIYNNLSLCHHVICQAVIQCVTIQWQ